jgi:hypothetical protein
MTAEPMMKGARRPVRAANQAPDTIPMHDNTYGGTVILIVLLERKDIARLSGDRHTAALSKSQIPDQRRSSAKQDWY